MFRRLWYLFSCSLAFWAMLLMIVSAFTGPVDKVQIVTNAAQDFQSEHKVMEEVVDLILVKRNISLIPHNTFEQYEKLRSLKLGGNPLVIPPNSTWFHHSRLQFLDLSDCGLGPVDPIAFKDLPNVKKIDMSGNPGCVESHKRACDAKVQYKIICKEFDLMCQPSFQSVSPQESSASIVSQYSLILFFSLLIMFLIQFCML